MDRKVWIATVAMLVVLSIVLISSAPETQNLFESTQSGASPTGAVMQTMEAANG